jgi:hypothetical protein
MIFNKFQTNQALALIQKLLNEGKRVSISEVKENRTLPQNKLMWLWLSCLEAETGNNKETLHEYFKEMFLPLKSDIVFNKEIIKRTSTTDLNTLEFKKYLDNIQLFASKQGIILPNPEDRYWNEFYETYKDFI